MRYVVHTIIALLAFAGNSVLCRLALAENNIDAASFTSIRLLSGVIVLIVILRVSQGTGVSITTGSRRAPVMLFLYAVCFSFAYISLDTGTGALILFGAVQITMISAGILKGSKLHVLEWLGVAIAFLGFVYLVLPGLGAPSLDGFILMSVAGISWGFYTMSGHGSENPLADTANNFYRTLPFVMLLTVFSFQHAAMSSTGFMLAVLSGGVASGLGYTIWYSALKGLSATQAAVVQLFVPVIAATGGIIFANEAFTWRLLFSSLLILGGILAVVMGKHYARGLRGRK